MEQAHLDAIDTMSTDDSHAPVARRANSVFQTFTGRLASVLGSRGTDDRPNSTPPQHSRRRTNEQMYSIEEVAALLSSMAPRPPGVDADANEFPPRGPHGAT